jgi:hypothetical protein
MAGLDLAEVAFISLTPSSRPDFSATLTMLSSCIMDLLRSPISACQTKGHRSRFLQGTSDAVENTAKSRRENEND